MARMCRDCGIGDHQDCVCDGDAGLDHPHVPNIYSERKLAPDRDGCNEDSDPEREAASPSLPCSGSADLIDGRLRRQIQRDDQARDEAA